MAAFKEMLEADVWGVFINLAEFGELRTIEYDGVTYENVPVVLTKNSSSARHIASTFTVKDHAQGLMRDNLKVHVKRDSIGDVPEKGTRFYISDIEQPDFMHAYYVHNAKVDQSRMVTLELEEIDE